MQFWDTTLKEYIAKSDLLRHYAQVLEKTSDLSLTLEKIKTVHRDTYDSMAAQIAATPDRSTHAKFISLIGENLQDCELDEVIIRLHYQSAMESLNNKGHALHASLSGRIKYLIIVFILALGVLALNEFFIRPTFLEIGQSLASDDQLTFFREISVAFLLLSFLGIALLIWLGRQNQGLDQHLKMAEKINSWGFMRSVSHAWQDYISATFVRLIAASGATHETAIEAVRQSLNRLSIAQPNNINFIVIQTIFTNLENAHKLDTFREELAYWEHVTLDEVLVKLTLMRTIIISIVHVLIAILVLLVLIQMYLPTFRLGGIF